MTATDSRPATPEEYIAALDEPRRTEIRRLDEMIRRVAPHLERGVASGMLGYGPFHYRYASGREGDTFRISLASQKRHISLYVLATAGDRYVAETFKDRLPKADIGRSCVRLKRLSDVDEAVLEDLIREGAGSTDSPAA